MCKYVYSFYFCSLLEYLLLQTTKDPKKSFLAKNKHYLKEIVVLVVQNQAQSS